MALFKNMAITNKGMALFAKAQAGTKITFTKMRVGSGEIGTQNPAALTDLVNGKLDVPISSIAPNPELKSATVVGNVTNSGLAEPIYICEIGIYAEDPDEGEILYGYSNSGAFGDYYAPESQGPYSWQYQISVAIGNAANVTVELTELNLDYGLINTNTTFMVLKGGNQKELNKNIDTKLKDQSTSIVEVNNEVVKVGQDLVTVEEDLGSYKIENTKQRLKTRSEVEDIKLKLAENNIIDFLNKTGIGFYDLFNTLGYIDTINTTATVSDNNIKFTDMKLLKMKEQSFDSFNNLELNIYDTERFTINSMEDSLTNQIKVMITPGALNPGDKFYCKGNIYTVSSINEVI